MHYLPGKIILTACSEIRGPIYEIVQSLTEVQNSTEKQLFKERLEILRSHSSM